MKKCPYCAEEIQDDALFCRFCGKELNPKPPKPTVSPWKRGALGSAILTLFVFFFAGVNVGTAVTGFFIWWVVFAAVVALWQHGRK